MNHVAKPFARTVCFFGALLFGGISAQAEMPQAQSFVCKSDGEVREVSVDFAPGNRMPCSVNYTKHGEKKLLWQAQHETNYCGVRAQELIAKLERTGWQCDLSDAKEVTAAAVDAGVISNKTLTTQSVKERVQ